MDEKETSDIPSKVRDLADKSVEQARGAIGTLLEAAQKAADAIQTNAKTSETSAGIAVSRGFGYAKENISAIFDFAQQLVRSPSLDEAVKLQSDFVKTQSAKMKDQLEELKKITPPPEA